VNMRLTGTHDNAATPPEERGALSRGRRARPRGQALVEFALVFLPFITLVFGMLDGGFFLFNGMTVSNAAREGAHIAATVPPESRYDAGSYTALVQNAVTGAAGGLTVTVKTPDCVRTDPVLIAVSATCAWVDPSDIRVSKKSDYVRVTVTYTYTTFFPLFFGATFNSQSQVDMLLEN
jgi:Flp pilus assembly protein TadG